MTDTGSKQQKPLRILMVAACPFPWPRGTPIRIQRLAQALVQEGHKVDVVTYHLGEFSDRLPFNVHRIANVFYYNRVSAGPSLTKLFVLDPLLVRCLLKTANAEHYDIIHAHHIEGVMTALTARAMGLKLPIVYDAHTLVGTELLDYDPRIGSGLKRFIGDFVDHRFAGMADSVIAVTDCIKAAFLERDTQPINRIYVISNGIEDDFIRRADQARRNFNASVAEKEMTLVSVESPVFMFAGNTAAYQGIDIMLKAFSLVLQHIPGARLKIITNESFAEYQSLAESMGIEDSLSISNVAVDELPDMIVQADVLLNPRTRCAGIPQKLLNYMAAGRPVVSFVGSAKIITDRVEGLVVKNGDIQAFADAMLELVENRELGRELSEAALKLVVARFSWSSAAKQTQNVYRDTLARYAEK
ncbi:MAG: glycosyltransferase family 4 protein [Gammaproteobacteria bacterium]|nr:glycosyltransferase family 4 protein [Gammaproteobacteria bacterium]